MRIKAVNTPDWIAKVEYTPLPDREGHWGRADYLEKMLDTVRKVMTRELSQARTVTGKGFLQRLNPRIKLLGFALVLLAVALSGSLLELLAIHGLLLFAALISQIGLTAYLFRSWLPAVFFAGFAVLPAICSWVTPGQSLTIIYQDLNWQVGPFNMPAELAVTREGLAVAALVMLRSTASLGLAVLLIRTTRWAMLSKSLAGLGLPGMIVMILDLTYRYLFLFLLLFGEYLLGRKSRLAGLERPGLKLNWIGSTMAGFFRLACQYSSEITAAMQARGYSGEYRPVPVGPVGKVDIFFLVITALILAEVLGGVPSWLHLRYLN